MKKCAYKEKALLANLLQDEDRAKEIAESLSSFVHPRFMALLVHDLETTEVFELESLVPFSADSCDIIASCATVLAYSVNILVPFSTDLQNISVFDVGGLYGEPPGILTLKEWEDRLPEEWENWMRGE